MEVGEEEDVRLPTWLQPLPAVPIPKHVAPKCIPLGTPAPGSARAAVPAAAAAAATIASGVMKRKLDKVEDESKTIRQVAKDDAAKKKALKDAAAAERAAKQKTVPCKRFIAGRCDAGDECPFSHDPSLLPVKHDLCKFFLTGACGKGAACRYSHDTKSFPCKFFHHYGGCEKGAACAFHHHVELSVTEKAWLAEEMVRDDIKRAARLAPLLPTPAAGSDMPQPPAAAVPEDEPMAFSSSVF